MDVRELSWKGRGRLWMRIGIRVLLAAAAILLVVYAGPPLLSLFMPFVLALLMAWILNPMVRWLQRKLKISRKPLSLLLIILVLLVAGGILGLFLYELGSEVYSLVANWALVGGKVEQIVQSLVERFSHVVELLPAGVSEWIAGLYENLKVWLGEVVPGLLATVGVGAGSVAMKVPSIAVGAAIFLVATYFITADYPRIRLMATDRMSPGVHKFLSSVRKVGIAALGGYVRAQLILSLVVFFILLIGFLIVGQSYALLLAFVFAIMDFIPIIGSGTVIVPWSVINLLTGNYRGAIELMIIWGIICVFRRVAEPKIVGDQTGLSPIMSLISIYVGMRLAGVLGMILGPVVVMVLMSIAKMDVMTGIRNDIRLVVQDTHALLSAAKKKEEEDKS